MRAAGGLRRRERAGPADAGDAAGPDHAACARARDGMRPDANDGAGKHRARGATTGQSQEPLGDRLAKSDGVLCPPPGVDPAMRAPAPEGGNMPVIPPPGSPGGDPNVRPK